MNEFAFPVILKMRLLNRVESLCELSKSTMVHNHIVTSSPVIEKMLHCAVILLCLTNVQTCQQQSVKRQTGFSSSKFRISLGFIHFLVF